VNTGASTCPCNDAAIESEHYSTQRILNITINPLVLCILNAQKSVRSNLDRLQLDDIILHFINTNEYHPKDCNVLLNVTNELSKNVLSDQRRLCPGICRPIPVQDISYRWLERKFIEIEKNALITCTLTGSMIIDDDKNKKKISLEVYLRAVFWQRIMECYERKLWYPRYVQQFTGNLKKQDKNEKKIDVPRRIVFSVVIWIGSHDKLSLIEEQSQTLSNSPFTGNNGVLGWAATDQIYPCRQDKLRCLDRRSYTKFKYLPKSDMNYMPPGWACAQRRPLRSLAHILTLLNPTTLILLDDDTYLNYDLLIKKYGNYLSTTMVARPLVIGELGGNWGDAGTLTKWGIFAGGAGYILGRRTIQLLTSYKIKYNEFENSYKVKYNEFENSKILMKNLNYTNYWRSREQVLSLSVYREGVKMSVQHCKGKKSNQNACIINSGRSNNTYTTVQSFQNKKNEKNAAEGIVRKLVYVPIAVRLIDFCTNLMANENTCHHSDHSMGRCLIYGAYADPVNSGCHSTAPPNSLMRDRDYLDPHDKTGVKIGLCFMTPTCNLSEQITCHRYKHDVRTSVGQVVRVSTRISHYKVYSSMYNGSFTDSNM